MNHHTLFSGWLFMFSVCLRTTSRGGVSLFIMRVPGIKFIRLGGQCCYLSPSPTHCILSVCFPPVDTCLCPVSGNWQPRAWAHLLAPVPTSIPWVTLFSFLSVKCLLCERGDLSLNLVSPCVSVTQPRRGRDRSSLASQLF